MPKVSVSKGEVHPTPLPPPPLPLPPQPQSQEQSVLPPPPPPPEVDHYDHDHIHPHNTSTANLRHRERAHILAIVEIVYRCSLLIRTMVILWTDSEWAQGTLYAIHEEIRIAPGLYVWKDVFGFIGGLFFIPYLIYTGMLIISSVKLWKATSVMEEATHDTFVAVKRWSQINATLFLIVFIIDLVVLLMLGNKVEVWGDRGGKNAKLQRTMIIVMELCSTILSDVYRTVAIYAVKSYKEELEEHLEFGLPWVMMDHQIRVTQNLGRHLSVVRPQPFQAGVEFPEHHTAIAFAEDKVVTA